MSLKAIEDVLNTQWVEIEAEVIQIWDNETEAIKQVGILKDDTGIIRFVSWEKSNKPLLVEGITYHFKNLPVSEFEDKLSVGIVATSEIERVGDSGTAQSSEIPTV